MKQNPLSIVGLVIILMFIGIAVAAPVLAPTPAECGLDVGVVCDPDDPFIIPGYGYQRDPLPPSPEHPFGTTPGEPARLDIYYGIVWGTRNAFRVGLVVVGSALLIGIALGLLAGFRGGLLDEVIMRIVDIMLAFPGLILAIAFVAAFGQSLQNIMIAVAAVWWPSYVRLVRGDVLAAREQGYVEAARAIGAGDARIMGRHIMPNVVYPILILSSMDIGAVVLVIAALSFLGLGPATNYADWGGLVNLTRNYIVGQVGGDALAYWYTYVYPGLFIFLFVLGWNLLGDAFRDILDPKVRR
jgi:peptide/nickel transport system permease protein